MSGDYSATYAGDWFSLTTKRPVYGHADSHALVHHLVLGPTGRCITCCRTGTGRGKNKKGWWTYKSMGIGECENYREKIKIRKRKTFSGG